MILKKIYWMTGLKNGSLFYFLSGIVIALAGILIGKLIFSQNIGLVAVFLTSLAAISLVDKEISLSEIILGRMRRLGGKIVVIDEIVTVQHSITLKSIYADHKNLFSIYTFLFLGIMATFLIITLFLPVQESSKLFGEQYKIISSNAFNPLHTFTEILVNNFFVLLTGLFLAFLFEFGTTFIIVWNASVWGTAFALVAKTPFAHVSSDPFSNFLLILVLSLPHLILEAVSYFSSSIAGGLLNKALIQETFWSTRFKIIATHSTILFVFGLLTLGIAALTETILIGFLA